MSLNALRPQPSGILTRECWRAEQALSSVTDALRLSEPAAASRHLEPEHPRACKRGKGSTRQRQHPSVQPSELESQRDSHCSKQNRFFPELLFAVIKARSSQPEEEHFWKMHQPRHARVILLSPRPVPDTACLSETTLMRSGAPFPSSRTNDVKRWYKIWLVLFNSCALLIAVLMQETPGP